MLILVCLTFCSIKKSWSVILKSFKMHFNDQKCIHKEVKGEAATEKCILHSTPVMLYFSVFLSASSRLLAQLYRLHLSIDACDPNTFLTNYEVRTMASNFFTATNLSKTSCLKYHLTDHQLCIFL